MHLPDYWIKATACVSVFLGAPTKRSQLPEGTDLSLVESLLGELAADHSLRDNLAFGALFLLFFC